MLSNFTHYSPMPGGSRDGFKVPTQFGYKYVWQAFISVCSFLRVNGRGTSVSNEYRVVFRDHCYIRQNERAN